VKQVTIFTDGSCLGNPGPGGWSAILRYGDREKELFGGEAHTTNNRMEMLGAVEALNALRETCEVELYSDSSYLVDAFSKGWIVTWQRNGWRTSSKQDVKNVDLWKRLLELTSKHRVRFHYVRGHNGHPENERCDKLARDEATRIAARR
jgi:ribonuclease HI